MKREGWGGTIAAAAALALSACAGTPPPEPRVVTQTVKVPVTVPCEVAVKRDVSRYADEDAGAASDIFEQVKLLLIGIQQRKVSEAKLTAAVTGCGGTVE